MNRRNFLGTMVAVAVAAVLPTPAPVPVDLELLKQRGVMGYLWNVPTPQPTPGAITLEGMADAFAEVQRYDLAPTFMFVNPRVYKEWNPAGYAELVRLQNETSNPT